MNSIRANRQRVIVGVIIALVVIGAVVVALDWAEMQRIIGAADWRPILPALLFTAFSYTINSYQFTVAIRLFGVKMGVRDITEIGFVSIALNHLVSAGGVAGFSVRFLLMGQHGAKMRDVVTASLFHSYVNSLGMMALFPIGLVYLAVRHPLSQRMSTAAIIIAVVLIVLFAMATALLFLAPLRARLLHLANRLVHSVLKRDISGALEEFNLGMTEGLQAALASPGTLALLFALTAADWLSSVATLWFCFRSLGVNLALGVLLTGFSFSVTAGILSMVPGGVGIQEGSMAGLFALLGVSVRRAALAAILYRIVFYVVPYAVSLLFYRRLLRRAGQSSRARRQQEKEETTE